MGDHRGQETDSYAMQRESLGIVYLVDIGKGIRVRGLWRKKREIERKRQRLPFQKDGQREPTDFFQWVLYAKILVCLAISSDKRQTRDSWAASLSGKLKSK